MMKKRDFLTFGLLCAALTVPAALAAPSVGSTRGSAPTQSKISLTLRAKVYFGDQDERAVPIEANFYLLDQDLVQILRGINLKPSYPGDRKHRISDADYLEAAARALTAPEDDDEAAIVAVLINGALLKHGSSVLRTNDFGRVFTGAVKPGRYFLFGVGRVDDEIIVWHQPLSIKAGVNAVEIDQGDAELIFSAEE